MLSHADGDIIKQGPELIAVWFGDARFQVTEVMYPARPRDREIRERAVRARKARRIDDLMERGTITSDPMKPQAVLELIVQRAREKAGHYAGRCAGIDLLVYVNLRGHHLYPTGPFPPGDPGSIPASGFSLVGIVAFADRPCPPDRREYQIGDHRRSDAGRSRGTLERQESVPNVRSGQSEPRLLV